MHRLHHVEPRAREPVPADADVRRLHRRPARRDLLPRRPRTPTSRRPTPRSRASARSSRPRRAARDSATAASSARSSSRRSCARPGGCATSSNPTSTSCASSSPRTSTRSRQPETRRREDVTVVTAPTTTPSTAPAGAAPPAPHRRNGAASSPPAPWLPTERGPRDATSSAACSPGRRAGCASRGGRHRRVPPLRWDRVRRRPGSTPTSADARNDAAQLVRVQTIRTSLVKADANATNAFLVGGLEPAAARAGYADGIATARPHDRGGGERRTRTTPPRSQAVNRVLATYTGSRSSRRARTIARASRSAPRTCARRRHRSSTTRCRRSQSLVTVEQQRVDDSVRRCQLRRPPCLLVVLLIAFAALVVLQIWLYFKTRRIFNVSLLVASGVVVLVGVVGLGVTAWSRSSSQRRARRLVPADGRARDGAHQRLRRQERREPDPDRPRFGPAVRGPFQDGAGEGGAASALGVTASAGATGAAFDAYLTRAHGRSAPLDDGGNWDQAVALATGTGAANRDVRDVRDRLGPRARRPGELALRRARQRAPAARP